MEIKKSPKADLENKKLLFIEIGLIVALAAVYFAFEWTTKENTIEELEVTTFTAEEEELVDITRPDEVPPPPAPKEPILSDDLTIVDDDIKIDDNLVIDSEDNDIAVDISDYKPGGDQEEEEVVEEEIPFAIVEEKPLFNGKDPKTEFQKWIYKNIEYPDIAAQNGIQGRVQMSFLVDTDGSVKDIKVLRGVDSSLDKEAIRVISKSPKWTPGKQRNKPVKVRYIFPVTFQLM